MESYLSSHKAGTVRRVADIASVCNDCQIDADFVMSGVTPDSQAIGYGCVYPDAIKTLSDQLNAAGKTWRAHMGDMGNYPNRESATCSHPALNTLDHTQSAEAPHH